MTLRDGCYKLHLRDTAHDGLKFWFNMPPYGNGTAGYAQIRQQGASGISHPLLHAVNPDFGKEYVFYFGVNRYTGVRENPFADNRLKIYPVPASDAVH